MDARPLGLGRHFGMDMQEGVKVFVNPHDVRLSLHVRFKVRDGGSIPARDL